MKCRILTDGTRFRAQAKSFCFWFDVEEYWSAGGCCGYSRKLFWSDSDAVEYLKVKFGESARIDRPWRVSIVAGIEELAKSAHNKSRRAS